MRAKEIVEQLQDKKGQHVLVTWQRQCKTRKSFEGIVEKRTQAWVRSGIAYANLRDIRDAIEAGEREPVEGLPWGEWREGAVNYIIDHKGNEYVRLYPAVFDNLHPTVWYTLDGKTCQYADVAEYLLASERHRDEENPACFTINADNILSIGD